MKNNKYNIGDMFLMSHGGLYRGIICEIDKDAKGEYVIYWTSPNQIVNSVGYNKYEIQTNIGQGQWKYHPVKE